MAPPRKYDRESITDEIFGIIAHSDQSLWVICKNSDKYPSPQEVTKWIASDAQIREKYAQAKESQADFMAAQITAIADECRIGEKTERKEIGRACSICLSTVKWRGDHWQHVKEKNDICDGAEAHPIYEEKIVTGDMVERSRLQIDARKWLAAKLAPKKYGDKTTISGDEDNPLRVIQKIERTIVRPQD